jgi:hypothetical protein
VIGLSLSCQERFGDTGQAHADMEGRSREVSSFERAHHSSGDELAGAVVEGLGGHGARSVVGAVQRCGDEVWQTSSQHLCGKTESFKCMWPVAIEEDVGVSEECFECRGVLGLVEVEQS